MPLSPIEAAILWVNTLTGLPTYRPDQPLASHIPPGEPYMTAHLVSDLQLGQPTRRYTDEAVIVPPDPIPLYNVRYIAPIDGILRVDAYNGSDPVQVLRALRAARPSVASREILEGEILSVAHEIGSVLRIPIPRDVSFEAHAQCDFRARWGEAYVEPLEAIETVESYEP